MQVKNLLDRGLIPYMEGDRIQREAFDDVKVSHCDDTLIVAQFEPTYTAGRRTKPEDIVDADLPVISVDRGGSVTWHGPGQLVIYPIIRLADPTETIGYIRAVEAAVIEAVRTTWHLPVVRIEGKAGVWLRDPDRKLCAIGLKVAQGATMHGLALNVNPDFSRAFTGIIPCGLHDCGVASLVGEGVDGVSVADATDPLIASLTAHLEPLTYSAHESELAATK